jgi:cell division protein FtsL
VSIRAFRGKKLPTNKTMTRRKTDSPISLFSFQDIIMSVVGIVILITLILLLQLVSQMLAAPPTPTITVQEVQQQIADMQPVLTELQNSIADLHHAKEQSEVFTPSQDQVDALQSTVHRLETNVALAEKKIDEIQKSIDELQNSPAIRQLAKTEQDIIDQTDKLADMKQQTKDVADNTIELQAKILELKAKNTALDQQVASSAAVQLKVTIPQDSDKTAFILDYGDGKINVIPTDGSRKQTFSSQSQFFTWAGQRDYKTEHFVVYVRPSRFGRQDEIIKNLRARGFDVGLQVIDEKTDLTLND